MATLKISELLDHHNFPTRPARFLDIVDPELIKPAPTQRTLDLSHVDKLKTSIQTLGGLVHPIEIEIWNGIDGSPQFYSVHGQHRLAACIALRTAGIRIKIPATLAFVPYGVSSTAKYSITNSVDLQKKDTVLDRYITYSQLYTELKRSNKSDQNSTESETEALQAQVAKILGVDVRTVIRVLKISKLPEPIRHAIREEIYNLKDSEVYSISDRYTRDLKRVESAIKNNIKAEWEKTIKDPEDPTSKEKRKLKEQFEAAQSAIEAAREQVLVDCIGYIKDPKFRNNLTATVEEVGAQKYEGAPSAAWIKVFKARLKELGTEISRKDLNNLLAEMC